MSIKDIISDFADTTLWGFVTVVSIPKTGISGNASIYQPIKLSLLSLSYDNKYTQKTNFRACLSTIYRSAPFNKNVSKWEWYFVTTKHYLKYLT